MASATEVARAKNQILGDRAPNSATAEERVLALADTGSTAYQQNDNLTVVKLDMVVGSVDTWVFIAPSPCRVLSIKELHSVVGSTSAAVKFRKITADATAPGATAGATVIELATAAFDLTATANTLQTATLSTTATDLILAAGDKIAADFSGTLTGLVGTCFLAIASMP